MFRWLFILFASCVAAQAGNFEIIFQKQYADLPFETRIDPSGIYGISSFTVAGNIISLQTFDAQDIFEYSNNTFVRSHTNNNTSNSLLKEKSSSDENVDRQNTRQCYLAETSAFRVTDEGLVNDAGEQISVRVPSRNKLVLSLSLNSGTKEQSFSFNNNLAAADLIGIDQKGREYIIVEKFISDIPLNIKREVWTISSNGSVLSILEVPAIKYLSTIKDFTIDAEGNLYHLLTEQSKVSVIKWTGLGNSNGEIVAYPKQYQYSLHYNQLVPKREAASKTIASPVAAASRTQALHIGESYVLYKYVCRAVNLSPNPVAAPDGDTVKTPPRLIVGNNAKVAYKWGGFNTLSGYATGLTKGYYAGDIDTESPSSYAVGVDCSGFVSRCWQLTSHVVTSDMPGITTQYSTWDSLRPGDAIHRDGHVRMFIQKNSNGSLKVVESSGRDWGVSYWSYMPSELTIYTPRYYNGMDTNYSLNRPTMYSALLVGGGVTLQWQCDTAGVVGYRLYYSTDNSTWTLIKNESTLKTNSATVSMLNTAGYFRVASVNGTALVESDWSNVMGAGNFGSAQKVLVLDGFYRETGTWRGAGHTFVYNYGKALESKKLNFESVSSKQLNIVRLAKYASIFRISGDQSTADSTITNIEQDSLKTYLEQGGCLFISGSELGWDLSNKGSTADKAFYNNYLKAVYVADDAGVETVQGETGSALAKVNLQFAQTYEVDFPDEINTYGGSTVAMRYTNNKVAGVQYTGTFGTSVVAGKVIYFAFPLETTANDTAFSAVINQSLAYFSGVSGVKQIPNTHPVVFALSQNYPNPFNPTTTIRFSIAERQFTALKIFDVLGKEVCMLVNEEKPAGEYQVSFNAGNLASGIYFYTLHSGNFTETKKLILVK